MKDLYRALPRIQKHCQRCTD